MRPAACVSISFLCLLMMLSVSVEAGNNPPMAAPFWSDLGTGPYSVGFRVLYRRDRRHKWLKNASATADPGRPIRVGVWYPAIASTSSKPMTYGDYLRHDGPSDFRQLDEDLDKIDRESWLSDLREISPPAGEKDFERLLSTQVAAYRDAAAAQGRFPLLLYSGGKASRADANVELAEYLASHGYVVATVPQLGTSNEDLELGSSPEEIALHADDFDAALTALRQLPEIDFSRIAAAGHSAGGEAAVLLALRHPKIRGVIGLDASYGMAGGMRVLKQLPGYKPGRRVGTSLLDLRRADGSQGVKLDLSGIDALRWEHVYRKQFPKAFHGDFTEWGMTAFKLAIPMPPNPDGHTRQIGYDVNIKTCHAVLDFLDARLRGNRDALQRLMAMLNEESH